MTWWNHLLCLFYIKKPPNQTNKKNLVDSDSCEVQSFRIELGHKMLQHTHPILRNGSIRSSHEDFCSFIRAVSRLTWITPHGLSHMRKWNHQSVKCTFFFLKSMLCFRTWSPRFENSVAGYAKENIYLHFFLNCFRSFLRSELTFADLKNNTHTLHIQHSG